MEKIKRRKTILTVTLNPAIDKTVRIAGFSLGKDFRTNDIFLSAGGKGVNVSQVLKSLGAKTKACGFVGGAAGWFIVDQLRRDDIPTIFIPLKEETRTSLTIIDTSRGKITRILEYGPRVSRVDFRLFKERFMANLSECAFVVFSGRNAYGLSDSTYRQLIQLTKRLGVLSVLDTSGPALIEGLKARPFIIKPNVREAESIVKNKLRSLKQIKEATRYLHNKGIAIVIVSMGFRGAVFSNGRESCHVLPPMIKTKNTVGCGDALVGGFLYSWMQSRDFVASCVMAVACGTANALTINPGVISLKEVYRLKKRIKVNFI